MASLSRQLKPLLAGIEATDLVAFDFHKWAQLPYDAGCIIVRDADAHRAAFARTADYLRTADRGLAAGAPWPATLARSCRAEAENLIIRKTDSADRRNNLLVLVPAGRKLLRRIQPAIEALEVEVGDRLGPELKSVMIEALRRLAD